MSGAKLAQAKPNWYWPDVLKNAATTNFNFGLGCKIPLAGFVTDAISEILPEPFGHAAADDDELDIDHVDRRSDAPGQHLNGHVEQLDGEFVTLADHRCTARHRSG